MTTCLLCGEEIVSPRRFCNRHCSGRYYTERMQTHTAVVARSQARETSPNLGHKIEMICDGCGTAFREYASRRPKSLKFCTKSCGLDYQKRTGNGGKVQTVDTEPVIHPHPSEPGMNVVYDPVKKEIRNE